MADDRSDKHKDPSDEVARDQEADTGTKPRPEPSLQQARDEVEEEDRFEATDN